MMNRRHVALATFLVLGLSCGVGTTARAEDRPMPTQAQLNALDAKNGFQQWKLGSAMPAAYLAKATPGDKTFTPNNLYYQTVVHLVKPTAHEQPYEGDAKVVLTYYKRRLLSIRLHTNSSRAHDEFRKTLEQAYGPFNYSIITSSKVRIRDIWDYDQGFTFTSVPVEKQEAADTQKERNETPAPTPTPEL